MKFITIAKLKEVLKNSEEALISEYDFKCILDEYGEEWFYDRAEGWTKVEEEK